MAPEPEILIEHLPTLAEATGFLRAVEAHVRRLHAPADRPRPVVLPSYDGTRRQPNLTALLALLLKRYGVTVCIHGAPGRGSPLPMTTAAVLLELGIEPARDLADAQARLEHDDIAYVPVDVLAPTLPGLRSASVASDLDRLVPALVRLVDPFGGDGYRVIGARSAQERTWMHDVLAATGANALLVAGAEGEPFVDPAAPWLESFIAGVATGSESEVTPGSFLPVPAGGPAATAAAIERVLTGELPVPDSILVQLGCCLAGVRC
jgi:anthranilate phosphoribosyltransferase